MRDEWLKVDKQIKQDMWVASMENDEWMKRIRELNDTPHCLGSKRCRQTSMFGIAPTRAQAFVMTHTRRDVSYRTERTRKLCERITQLIPNDPAARHSVTEGTVR